VQAFPEPLAFKDETLTLVTAVSPVPSLILVNFIIAKRSPSRRVWLVTASAIFFPSKKTRAEALALV
jgi:hypothetical protein